jgi:hypothetical protein
VVYSQVQFPAEMTDFDGDLFMVVQYYDSSVASLDPSTPILGRVVSEPTPTSAINSVSCPYGWWWDPTLSWCKYYSELSPATPFVFSSSYPEYSSPAWFYVVYQANDVTSESGGVGERGDVIASSR